MRQRSQTTISQQFFNAANRKREAKLRRLKGTLKRTFAPSKQRDIIQKIEALEL